MFDLNKITNLEGHFASFLKIVTVIPYWAVPLLLTTVIFLVIFTLKKSKHY